MAADTLRYAPGSGIVVDLDRLVASRLLVQANSGGGKSRAIRQLLEETHGRIQHIVIDPEGEFATLRERYDYVLAAPKDGDVLATPKTAKLLCRRLVELGASAVLDIYDLPLPDRREFVKLLLAELMALPRSLWRPMIVVIDEAHVFAPQTGEAQSLEMVTALCTQGRKRGFCAVLATQRIAKLHKDAAAELLNKLIGRTGLDVDVKRAGDELGFDKDQRAALKSLSPGEFFAFGPAISNEVQRVRTGNVRTSHPEAGRVSAAPPPAPERVRKVLAQLADLAQKADEEARTIEDLERQNRELKMALRRAEKGTAATVVTKPVLDQAAIDRAVAHAIAQHDRSMRTVFDRRGKVLVQVATTLDRAVTAIAQSATDLRHVAELALPATNGHAPAALERQQAPAIKSPPAIKQVTPVVTDAAIGRGAARLLTAMAQLHRLGVEDAPWAAVAGFCAVSHTTGTFSNQKRELRDAGLIEVIDSDTARLSEAGHAATREVPDLPSLEALHQMWYRKLGGTTAKLLAVLVEHYPNPITRAELAAAVGVYHTTGTFSNQLRFMRTPGLIRDVSKSELVATELLFPRGLS